MAPQFVKMNPNVLMQQNDAADAEAICKKTVTRQYAVCANKNGEQLAVLALHRARQRVRQSQNGTS